MTRDDARLSCASPDRMKYWYNDVYWSHKDDCLGLVTCTNYGADPKYEKWEGTHYMLGDPVHSESFKTRYDAKKWVTENVEFINNLEGGKS